MGTVWFREMGGFSIRLGLEGDIPRITAVEIEAGVLFESLDFPPPPEEGIHLPVDIVADGIAEERLWVAVDEEKVVVGFTLAGELGPHAHLYEIDVMPGYGRKGIGRALIATVERWALDNGYKRLTLTTFEKVPWNGLYYQKLGFNVIEAPAQNDALKAVLAKEREENTVAWERCAMIKAL